MDGWSLLSYEVSLFCWKELSVFNMFFFVTETAQDVAKSRKQGVLSSPKKGIVFWTKLTWCLRFFFRLHKLREIENLLREIEGKHIQN